MAVKITNPVSLLYYPKSVVNDQQVELGCISDNSDIKDEIDFRLSVGTEGAIVRVEYRRNGRSDNTDDGNHTKIKEEFEVSFLRLIEYLPRNESAVSLGYDWNQDEVLQTMDLSHWDAFSLISEDEYGVLHFYVQTKGGALRLSFKFSTYDIEELQMSANRIKVDVSIRGFHWLQNNTLLALMSVVKSKTELNTHYSASKDMKEGRMQPTDVTVTFNNATLPFGEFFWAKYVDIENGTKTAEVMATSPAGDLSEDASSQPIAFTFLNSNNASLIYWDPEAGVGYPKHENIYSSIETSMGRMGTTCVLVSIVGVALSIVLVI